MLVPGTWGEERGLARMLPNTGPNTRPGLATRGSAGFWTQQVPAGALGTKWQRHGVFVVFID